MFISQGSASKSRFCPQKSDICLFFFFLLVLSAKIVPMYYVYQHVLNSWRGKKSRSFRYLGDWQARLYHWASISTDKFIILSRFFSCGLGIRIVDYCHDFHVQLSKKLHFYGLVCYNFSDVFLEVVRLHRLEDFRVRNRKE